MHYQSILNLLSVVDQARVNIQTTTNKKKCLFSYPEQYKPHFHCCEKGIPRSYSSYFCLQSVAKIFS